MLCAGTQLCSRKVNMYLNTVKQEKEKKVNKGLVENDREKSEGNEKKNEGVLYTCTNLPLGMYTLFTMQMS